ncbi:lipopolysaccharide assembly protein LapA domain-containing protein [Gordonia sp. NPDC003376]
MDLLKRFWLPLILVVVAIIFIVQNREKVSVDFLFLSISSWQWLIYTIIALCGLIAGWVIGRNGAKRKAAAQK